MSSLVAFLNARLDEDEAAARDWQPHERYPDDPDEMGTRWNLVPTYTPARVLREVEAKRALLNRYWYCQQHGGAPGNEHLDPDAFEEYVLRPVAFVYSNHPDYRVGWKR